MSKSVRKSRPIWQPVFTVLVLIGLLVSVSQGRTEIPERPSPPPVLFDWAEILEIYDKERLDLVQQAAFRDNGIPISVVTIRKMEIYGGSGDVEAFTKRWMKAWELNEDSQGKGILVLVSVGDRKARIELGSSWNQSWSSQCQKIMDKEMVPRFRDGRYHDGIIFGVEALARMSSEADLAKGPKTDLLETLTALGDNVGTFSLLDGRWIFFLCAVGLVLILGAFFVQEMKWPLLGAGVLLITAALFTTVLLVLVFLGLSMFGNSGHHRNGYGYGYGSSSSSFSSGGFSGGGGGFSGGGGGFSGGGGASGSW